MEYDWKSGNKKECKNKMSLNLDETNNYVLEFVKDIVSQSSILKEKYKTEVLDKKESKVKDIKEEEKRLEKKIQRLQKSIERIENNIVEMEVQKGLGVKDENVIRKVISRFNQELEDNKTEYEKTETEIDELGKERLVEILLKEENLNTYIVSHGWTHPLLAKIEVIKEDNISRLE